MSGRLDLPEAAVTKVLDRLRQRGCKPRRVRGGWQATCPCCREPGALTVTTAAIVEREGEPAALVVASS